MSRDDPELLAAIARYNPVPKAPGKWHAAAAMGLLIVHGCLFLESSLSLADLASRRLEACIYLTCGASEALDRAFWLGMPAGGVLLLADIVVTFRLLLKKRRAVVVPVIGCAAQIVLLFIVGLLISDAGPIR